MTARTRRVVVVGAGSAGCLVAARLSEEPHLRVVLLEDGPDHSTEIVDAKLSSWNWLDALEATEAFVPDLMARRHVTDLPRQYRRGRGLGGTALLNAMIAMPGLPADYDRWASEFGLPDWSWKEVGPVFTKLKHDLMVAPHASLTPLDNALLSAAPELGLANDADLLGADDGAGRLWLNAVQGRRHSSRERYLKPAIQSGRLGWIASSFAMAQPLGSGLSTVPRSMRTSSSSVPARSRRLPYSCAAAPAAQGWGPTCWTTPR